MPSLRKALKSHGFNFTDIRLQDKNFDTQKFFQTIFSELIRHFNSLVLYNSTLFTRNNKICKYGFFKSRTFCNLQQNHYSVMKSLQENPIILIGVDGGGNKCRVCIETAGGILLGGSCVKRPSHIMFGDKTWDNIIEGSINILSAYEIPLETQKIQIMGCFGLAGSSVTEYVNKFKANRHMKLFSKLIITKDSEIAQVASHNLGNGGIIIIGTGSASFAKYEGQIYISGGRGFPLSDVGSGAYLGLKAAKALVRAFDEEEPWGDFTRNLAKELFENNVIKLVEFAKRANPTEFSQLAPYVVKYAKKDKVAEKIVMQGAKKIGILYQNTMKKINKQEAYKMKFCLLGGLSNIMKEYLPKDMLKIVSSPIYQPAKGAVLLARQEFVNKNK